MANPEPHHLTVPTFFLDVDLEDRMKSRHRPRVIIADDHLLVAEACKNLLEPEFDVIAVVPDGRALVQVAAEMHPDVLIVDVSMPVLNGLDAGEQIKQKNGSVKLIYLTISQSPDVAVEAFRRGASAYVVKRGTTEELRVALRRVLRGESYMSPLVTTNTMDLLLRPRATHREEKQMTSRQREVLQLFAEGKSMKEIAYILHLKSGTVAYHKYRIMDALGVKTKTALIEYAIKHHMISPQQDAEEQTTDDEARDAGSDPLFRAGLLTFCRPGFQPSEPTAEIPPATPFRRFR